MKIHLTEDDVVNAVLKFVQLKLENVGIHPDCVRFLIKKDKSNERYVGAKNDVEVEVVIE